MDEREDIPEVIGLIILGIVLLTSVFILLNSN